MVDNEDDYYDSYTESQLNDLYIEILGNYYRLLKSEEYTKELMNSYGKTYTYLNEDLKKQYLSFISFCEKRIKYSDSLNIDDEVKTYDVECRLEEQKNYEIKKFEDLFSISNCFNEFYYKETINSIYDEYDDIYQKYLDEFIECKSK